MNDRFEIIKNIPEDKCEFGNDVYLKYGGLLSEALDKMNLDGDEDFENDTFKIVPYDWDANDCTCGVDLLSGFMHSINCACHDSNFYHKPTGILISWRKHVSRFEYINKKITFEDWETIVEDCARSVLGDKYKDSEKETNNKNLDEYEKQLLKVSLKARMNVGYRALCDETLKSNHDSIREEIQTIREIADKLNLGKID